MLYLLKLCYCSRFTIHIRVMHSSAICQAPPISLVFLCSRGLLQTRSFICIYEVSLSPYNITLIHWINIDHVLLYIIMNDSCGTVHCVPNYCLCDGERTLLSSTCFSRLSRSACVREMPMTLAPSSANRTAIARPIPEGWNLFVKQMHVHVQFKQIVRHCTVHCKYKVRNSMHVAKITFKYMYYVNRH